MKMLEEDSPLEKALISMIVAINRQIPMPMEDQVLIAIKLNEEEKVLKFRDWVKSRLNGEKLEATAAEVMRAAVQIGEERELTV